MARSPGDRPPPRRPRRKSKPANAPQLRLVRRRHTLLYAMRLLPDQVLDEQTHPRVQVPSPDGGSVPLTLHTITGDAEEIKRRLLESVDAFFEIYGEEPP